MKKILAVLLSLCLVFGLCGCTFLDDIKDMAKNGEATPKTFDFEGVSIELTTDFLRMDFVSEDFDFVVGSGDITVLGLKADFEGTDISDYTTLEFAENFKNSLENIKADDVTEVDGIATFKYVTTEEEENLANDVMIYKGTNCFWVIWFSVTDTEYDTYHADIVSYAKTVKCN